MKITIYSAGSLMGSIIRTEAKLVSIFRKDYAQYKNVPHIAFIQKGKRNGTVARATYNPYILVIEGWYNPKPDDFLTPPKVEGGVIVRKSRYSSFDDRYKTDFDAVINPYIADKNVIVDIRTTTNTDILKMTA